MKRLSRHLVLLFFALVLTAAPARAEEPGPGESVSERILDILLEKKIVTRRQCEELKAQVEAERAAEAKEARAVYKPGKGFALETRDGSSSLALTGRLQFDYKTFTRESGDVSSFYVRRARLAARAKWHKYYSAFVEAEFGRGKTGLNDAFLDIRSGPQIGLRFGQFKQPFSMEELYSDNWIWTIERSLANSLAPSRDLGLMVSGDLGQGTAYYFVALSNGSGKNEAGDQNESKDLAARLVVAPLRPTGLPLFRDFYLGAAVTVGDQDSAAADWWRGGKLATPIGHTWFQINPGLRQDGRRTRYGGEVFWSVGPVAFMGELVQADFEGLTQGGLQRDLSLEGGYAMVTWMLTGEHPRLSGGRPAAIRPQRPFGFGPGQGWGAWQAVVRADWARADSDWRGLGFVDPASYADEAEGWTLGLNWYLNDMVRIMANFFSYKFSQPVVIEATRVEAEEGFLARTQLVF